jgi:hypothetical protein
MKRKTPPASETGRKVLKPSAVDLRKAARQRRRYVKLKTRLEGALRADGYSQRKAHDIAFHMLDWLEDLDLLWTLYRNVDRRTHKEICNSIFYFLTHAPHHLDAAKYLIGLGEPQDVFKLGFFRKAAKRKR